MDPKIAELDPRRDVKFVWGLPRPPIPDVVNAAFSHQIGRPRRPQCPEALIWRVDKGENLVNYSLQAG